MPAQIVAGGIHLINSTSIQVAGGTATAASTTPFSIRGRWPIQQAEQRPLFSGQKLLALSYDLITETIPINVLGTTHENAVALLQQLKRALNTSLFSVLPLLSVLPTASSTIMYSEILHATVREVTDDSGEFDAWEALGNDLDAEITWTRGSFFGAASLATLFTNTVFTNNGSGNLTALGTLAGDLIYEGSPLNIKIDGPAASSTNVDTLWIAAAQSRVKTTHTSATGSTTTSTSVHSTTTINATPLLANNGVNLAIFVRFSSVTAGNKAQFALQITSDDAKNIAPITAWQDMPVTSGTTMLYAGTFSLEGQRIPIATTLTLELTFWVRSTDGTSVAYTVDYTEAVFAYTVAEITQNIASSIAYGNGDELLYVTSAQNLNGSAWLPLAPTRVYVALGASVNPSYTLALAGEAPRGISGASLWVAWTGTLAVHTTTDTLRITPTHAPLFRSLRGAG